DPRPYQALLNQAKAKVIQDQARLAFDEEEHQRNRKLVRSGAVSRSDVDKTAAARGVDLANVEADKAVVASRELDLEYTKVRTPIGRPHKALLVNERALDTDQGQKILYVVNEKNTVVSRPVRVGALHNGLREIVNGLKADERVIVNGLQQVRPGVTVELRLV